MATATAARRSNIDQVCTDGTDAGRKGRSDTVARMADVEELAHRFRASGDDQRTRSPLYAGLNRCIADAPDVVELLTAAPEQQQLPVLLLAAVHDIVLAEPHLELGRWYPSISDEPLRTDPFPAFRRLCLERAEQIRLTVSTRVTQTNEVGRCALFVPALGLIEVEMGALSLVDVGTSAGLNLLIDRFRYRYVPGGDVGPPSAVEIECGTRGRVPIPDRTPAIAARIGIDRHPIDLHDASEARWLAACVWPDQRDRLARLRGAIEISQEHPPTLVRGDAVAEVGRIALRAAHHGHPVVINSWVLNYLDEPSRVAYVGELDRIGSQVDLSWVFAESPALCPGLPFPAHLADVQTTAVMLVRWRDGTRTVDHLGVAHPHGYWFHGPQ